MNHSCTHLIEISCEVTLPGSKTQTPVQLSTEGDGSMNHWLASFRSVLIAAGFNSTEANNLKIDRVSAKKQIETIRTSLSEDNG